MSIRRRVTRPNIFCQDSRAVKGVTLKMSCDMLRGFESHFWYFGGVAQMVERALCMREAAGSMPAISTTFTSYSKFIKSKQGCEHRYYCGFNSHSIIQHTRCEKIKLFIIYFYYLRISKYLNIRFNANFNPLLLISEHLTYLR